MVKKKLSKIYARLRANTNLISALSLALVLVIIFSVLNISRNKSGDTANDNGVVNITEEFPSENDVGEDYMVANGEPYKIEIASVGIKGFIQKVGIDQNKAVAAPNNVNLAGWFVESMKPGQKGLSIIDGHVSGRTKDGVFKNLPKVNIDNEIIITMGGGQTYIYKVFDVKTVPNELAASVLFEQDPSVESQLNLITCTGQFDRASQTYADRAIVYAALIN